MKIFFYVYSLFFLFVVNAKEFRMKFFNSLLTKGDKATLSNLIAHDFLTTLCIGTPKQCFDIKINMTEYYSFIALKNESGYQFIPDQSETLMNMKKHKIFGSGRAMKNANLVQDFILFNQYNKFYYQFYFSRTEENSELGLSTHTIEVAKDHSSFLDQLLNKQIISSSLMVLNYTSDNEGEIILDPSNEIIDRVSIDLATESNDYLSIKSPITILKLKNSKSNWNYNYHQSMRINYRSSLIIANTNMVKSLLYELFEVYEKHGACSIQQNKEQSIWAICNPKIKEIIENTLIISIDSNEIKVDLKDLFIPYYESVIFAIIGKEDELYFTVGDAFMKQFMISIDQENFMIKLYPKKENETNTRSIMKYIKYIIVFLCFLGILHLVSMYYIINTKQHININSNTLI